MSKRYHYAPSTVPPGDAQLMDWLRREFQAVRNGIDNAADERLRWRGEWAAGAYQENDLVLQNNWALVAKVKTTASPLSNPSGTWIISDDWTLLTKSA